MVALPHQTYHGESDSEDGKTYGLARVVGEGVEARQVESQVSSIQPSWEILEFVSRIESRRVYP